VNDRSVPLARVVLRVAMLLLLGGRPQVGDANIGQVVRRRA
jgi:hypothetical protein